MSYFNIERKRQATDTLKACIQCAKKAGINHALYINFGLLLGIVRERDYISHDNDVDLCINQDLIKPEQEILYRNYLKEAGVITQTRDEYSVRLDENGYDELCIMEKDPEKIKYVIDNKELIGTYKNKEIGRKVRLTWFTLRTKPDYPKFCHWFTFDWNGYTWHTKAGKWVKQSKFDHNRWDYKKTDEGIMKGFPAEFIEEFLSIDFYGLKVQIPKRFGSYLDCMYTNWLIPKNRGSSRKDTVCVVGKWSDKKTWRISTG